MTCGATVIISLEAKGKSNKYFLIKQMRAHQVSVEHDICIYHTWRAKWNRNDKETPLTCFCESGTTIINFCLAPTIQQRPLNCYSIWNTVIYSITQALTQKPVCVIIQDRNHLVAIVCYGGFDKQHRSQDPLHLKESISYFDHQNNGPFSGSWKPFILWPYCLLIIRFIAPIRFDLNLFYVQFLVCLGTENVNLGLQMEFGL